MSLSSCNEDAERASSLPPPASPGVENGSNNNNKNNPNIINNGEDYWLTIRRRCELCKQRKVCTSTPHPALASSHTQNTFSAAVRRSVENKLLIGPLGQMRSGSAVLWMVQSQWSYLRIQRAKKAWIEGTPAKYSINNKQSDEYRRAMGENWNRGWIGWKRFYNLMLVFSSPPSFAMEVQRVVTIQLRRKIRICSDTTKELVPK
jgi:hypothetical protein